MTELSKRFDFTDIDKKWSSHWESSGIFHATAHTTKKPYSIVIPPPNVTGILHMGHALNNTLQDIIIRYKRMHGFETLWMPGTDHAGIATQNVVEKKLAQEGKNRHDVGREQFLEHLWNWKNEYGDTIIRQLKSLGSSCDWERLRFTMDDDYSAAVRHTFVHLYKKGLIYQGKYIINWCPRCLTALSDEEAEHREIQGNLYHIRYTFKDNPNRFVTVATTRPETMLGDTAVAVNPADERYTDCIGKILVLPLVNREIPIIADEFVDPSFGTGAVKVTPSHDPNDFEMGRRHNLPCVTVMHPDGRITNDGGEFAGQDRFEAREAIIEDLREMGLLEKVEPHLHAVGHCYRCHTVVEPYLSQQWFVKMKPLAQPAIKVVEEGRIQFYPQRWTKVYMNWMENIRDWCISRQIWWGHRIPVWYCPDCPAGKNMIVEVETPTSCPHCGSKNLRQDEDVLDTWFSSWLWPFATLKWPTKNADLSYFYPTASLFTAPEIIFFWVARMIMAGMEFMGDIPFSDVYLHGTVRDAQGRKMSKSLGNAIDPLEIINEYGADALRFSLIINSGQDLFISKEKFEIGRNFANKLWNASRLILMNIPDDAVQKCMATPLTDADIATLDVPAAWILSHAYRTLAKVEAAIEQYRYSEAESLIYEFFWNTLCDWYLEIIKNNFTDEKTRHVVLTVLTLALKMMHPFMPFVTSEIWQTICPDGKELSVQPWPAPCPAAENADAHARMDFLIALIVAVRNIRAQWHIGQADTIECTCITTPAHEKTVITDGTDIIKRLARVGTLTVTASSAHAKNSATAIVGATKCIVPLGALIDIEKEKARMSEQLSTHTKAAASLNGRLSNEAFLEKAPRDIVEKEKGRLAELEAKITELSLVLKNFE